MRRIPNGQRTPPGRANTPTSEGDVDSEWDFAAKEIVQEYPARCVSCLDDQLMARCRAIRSMTDDSAKR